MGLDKVIKPTHSFRVFKDRGEWVDAATHWITAKLSNAIDQRSQAVIALSGGSTPIPIYKALSHSALPWDRVDVEFVDERDTNDPDGSNRQMITEALLKNKAANYAGTRFNDKTRTSNAHLDVCVMGMGTDGHTASWFPGSKGLEKALDVNAPLAIEWVDATGCPGAGKYPHRYTMTLPTVLNSREILLLITGEDKHRVFDEAVHKSVYDAPVKALLAAGQRLTVMWAP